jgi:hypothetical protein
MTSPPFPKCEHCPARDRSGPCLAQSTRHPRYCAFVDPDSPDYRPAYIALLAGGGPPVPSPEEVARARRAAKPRVPLGTRPPAEGD